jgi:hypothetical protein
VVDSQRRPQRTQYNSHPTRHDSSRAQVSSTLKSSQQITSYLEVVSEQQIRSVLFMLCEDATDWNVT